MGLRKSVLGAAVVLVLGLASAGRAQLDELKDTTPQQRAKAQTTFMKAKLGLSTEQIPKVEAINLKYAEKAEPVIKGDSGPFVKMRQMKEVNSEKESELQGVFSPDQFQKYLAAKDEMKEKVIEQLERRAGAP